MSGEDFFEGVRCAIVDKKDKPKWKYPSPDLVPDELIKMYFSSLPEELELKL